MLDLYDLLYCTYCSNIDCNDVMDNGMMDCCDAMFLLLVTIFVSVDLLNYYCSPAFVIIWCGSSSLLLLTKSYIFSLFYDMFCYPLIYVCGS